MIANFIFCACMFALSGYVWYETSGYPDYSSMAIVGPEAIPNLLAWIITILSVIVLLGEVVKILRDKTYFSTQTAGAKALAKSVLGHKSGIFRIVATLAMMFLYAALLKTVGFEICSAVFLVVTMLLNGVRNWKVLVLIPVGTIAVVFVVFVKLLHVSVPMLFL